MDCVFLMIPKALRRFVLVCLGFLLSATMFAQKTKLDWKVHTVGKVRQLVTNMGTLWSAATNYPGLIYSEFPPNSYEEHIGEAGIWIGAISGKDTSVSVTTSWHSSFEFYPGAEAWDTVWVVEKGDTAKIPYLPKYVGVSDQDFVCKYNDYNPVSQRISEHTPLYLDVIQESHAWSSPPFDEMIALSFHIIPTRNSLKDVYVAYWLDGNVGSRAEGWGFALDDRSIYDSTQHMGIAVDRQGGVDGSAYSPLGVKIYPPKNVAANTLRWTFNWIQNPNVGPPSRDPPRYLDMSAGTIMRDQEEYDGSQFFIAFGPFQLMKGDTLRFMAGLVFGKGQEGMYKNASLLDWLVERNFKVPSPPPRPTLWITTANKSVTLSWEPRPGDVNPELYEDPFRADSVKRPFEGYRLYKSTKSIDGPWTLLAEYDIVNSIGYDTGLQYTYKDEGLLNNLEYYYALTAFSRPDRVLDFPSRESSLGASARRVVPSTTPLKTVGDVAVVPNPYRGDIPYNSYNPPWEKPQSTRPWWMEQDRRLQFINLPELCEIKIYTLAGDLVNTIRHDNPNKGFEDWNLTSSVGQAISSGIYLFSVEDLKNGQAQIGKFVVIK